MAIKCFVDALKDSGEEIPVRIPPNYFNSTTKDVTWCANSSVYSKESDLETILARERRAFGNGNDD